MRDASSSTGRTPHGASAAHRRMTALPPRAGYALWAPGYERETAVSFLEDRLVAALGASTRGRRLLDVGCGTGRRLRDADAAARVGVDLTPEMLARGTPGLALAAGDLRALPIGDAAFDVVWCRLAIGHVHALGAAYAELARVCAAGGTVVVSDFHPAAAAAGHRRTFRGADGAVREIEHHVHAIDAHAEAARRAGLTAARPVGRLEGVVGPEIECFYADAGRHDAYAAQRGLPLVLALAWRREAA